MRLAQIVYHRWHSPIDAELKYNDSGNLEGNTLLRMIESTDLDIPGATAALEAAALEAAMLQTDRVGDLWYSQNVVNATMYPAPTIEEVMDRKRREEKARGRAEQGGVTWLLHKLFGV